MVSKVRINIKITYDLQKRPNQRNKEKSKQKYLYQIPLLREIFSEYKLKVDVYFQYK